MADAIPSLCIEFERLPGVQLSCVHQSPDGSMLELEWVKGPLKWCDGLRLLELVTT